MLVVAVWAQIYIPYHLMTEEHEGAPASFAAMARQAAHEGCGHDHNHAHLHDDDGDHEDGEDHDDEHHHHPHSAGDHLADWHVGDVPHFALLVAEHPLIRTQFAAPGFHLVPGQPPAARGRGPPLVLFPA